jgi:hypothetical protein
MIYNFKYSNNNDRTEILQYLKESNFKRVIDVGATAAGWSSEFLSHYVDINKWENAPCQGFHGNICLYSTWEPILKDVEENGLYDFVICSHTLEDIAAPQFVSEMLCKIAKEGFIAVPSKNMELTRNINGPYYGWVHHRWIYNKEGNKFVAYPKLNLIEHADYSHIVKKIPQGFNEISFYWKDDFEFNIVNDDYMGPDVGAVHSFFNKLGND